MAAKCSCAPTDNHLIPNYIGEQLLIGDDILVEALEVSGEQVRLSIAAPKDVKVLRDELLEEGAEDFQWRGQTTAMVQSMSFIPHAVIHVGQLPDHLTSQTRHRNDLTGLARRYTPKFKLM